MSAKFRLNIFSVPGDRLQVKIATPDSDITTNILI
jgi:hypothetical protein